MNKFFALLIITPVFCITTTPASAQQCKDGSCRLDRRVNYAPARDSRSYNQSDAYSPSRSTCVDGNCNRKNGATCRCDGESCNCIPAIHNREERGRYEPFARKQPQYRQTNFQAPTPKFNFQRRMAATPTSINWEASFDRGLQQARETGRPLLVRVTADWCGYCKQMKRETFAHPGVIRDIDSSFVAVSLDADANPELVRQMGVQSLPCTLVISGDLRIVDREQGFRSANQLGTVLQRHLRRAELQKDTLVAVR